MWWKGGVKGEVRGEVRWDQSLRAVMGLMGLRAGGEGGQSGCGLWGLGRGPRNPECTRRPLSVPLRERPRVPVHRLRPE